MGQSWTTATELQSPLSKIYCLLGTSCSKHSAWFRLIILRRVLIPQASFIPCQPRHNHTYKHQDQFQHCANRPLLSPIITTLFSTCSIVLPRAKQKEQAKTFQLTVRHGVLYLIPTIYATHITYQGLDAVRALQTILLAVISLVNPVSWPWTRLRSTLFSCMSIPLCHFLEAITYFCFKSLPSCTAQCSLTWILGQLFEAVSSRTLRTQVAQLVERLLHLL